MIKVLLVILFSFSNLVSCQNSCEISRLTAVKNGQQKPQGANLGSWFVLEGWITSNLWDDNGCDQLEYQGTYLLEKCLGDRAKSVMENHWSTWITEDDFIEMSKRGVNLVRIPVGWWQIYDPQGGADNASLNWEIDHKDYITGALPYLDKAFEWGKSHGIGILIDLHAAPGSQNGLFHSSPAEPGKINWDKSEANIGQSTDSMELYAQRYGNHEALFGFELLNEPVIIDLRKLTDYYKRTYDVIRKLSPDSYIILNPELLPLESGVELHWVNFMNPDQGYSKVALDLHYYSCFGGPQDTIDADFNIKYIQNNRSGQIADFKVKNPKLHLIGEWSACQHGDVNKTLEFFRKQIEVYNEASLGFIFWTWKLPGNDPWSLQDMFSEGWLNNFDHPC